MYQEFIEEFYNTIGYKTKEESGDIYSQALFLKKHLTEEIGRILTESVKYRNCKDNDCKEDKKLRKSTKKLPGGLVKSDEIVVKDIQFAYNNYKVIEILKKRGTAIA